MEKVTNLSDLLSLINTLVALSGYYCDFDDHLNQKTFIQMQHITKYYSNFVKHHMLSFDD